MTSASLHIPVVPAGHGPPGGSPAAAGAPVAAGAAIGAAATGGGAGGDGATVAGAAATGGGGGGGAGEGGGIGAAATGGGDGGAGGGGGALETGRGGGGTEGAGGSPVSVGASTIGPGGAGIAAGGAFALVSGAISGGGIAQAPSSIATAIDSNTDIDDRSRAVLAIPVPRRFSPEITMRWSCKKPRRAALADFGEQDHQGAAQFRRTVRLAQHRTDDVGVAIRPHEIGKAGGEQHLELRAQFPRRRRQIDPIEPSRHHDIGEQQIDPQIGVRQQQAMSLVAAGSLEDAVTGGFDHRQRHLAHLVVVLDNKDRFAGLVHAPPTQSANKTALRFAPLREPYPSRLFCAALPE